MPPRRGGRRRGTPQKNRTQQHDEGNSDTQDSFSEFLEKPEESDVKCDAKTEEQNEICESVIQENVDVTVEQNQEGEIKSEIKTEEEIKNEEEMKTEKEEIKVNENNESTENQVDQNVNDVKEEAGKENEEEATGDLPYKVKVSHLPGKYVLSEFQKYISMNFKVSFRTKPPKIISPGKNSPWVLMAVATKEDQEKLIRFLHNHVWKKKALRAIAFYGISSQKRKAEDGEGPDGKKFKSDELPVLTLEEEILSESLPLYSIPYEEQNRLTIVDVELLSNKLHAFMCVRNPSLDGWAEAMCEQNNGTIFKIEPLKTSPILKGYRNRCKFRIGKNTEGETTVGFCLNDNENKILGVQPGDKLIHLLDSMKYAAKKFEDFIRASGKEPYDKKKKTGFWDHIILRTAPNGTFMLVVIMYHNQLSDEAINEVKNQVKEYFVNGDGKDCNLYSLYFQVMYDKPPVLPHEKLELLHGESHFYETICGLIFHVEPFSIMNVNSSSSENVYNSIIELAEPTPDTVVLDLCSGTGGIAFTIARKCKKVIAIESHEDPIKNAMKTKEVNNIQNVEFIKGKVEDELAGVFEKLGDSPIIPIIDPPRQGLVQKAISQLRAQENIKKLVYVCSNSKMGAKNFLDLCAPAEKKEGTFGNPLNVVFEGLPFLPVRVIPVDVAPYTVNNTIIILFERIDPTTFPPPKMPPPLPLKRPQTKSSEKKRKRYYVKRTMKGGRSKGGQMKNRRGSGNNGPRGRNSGKRGQSGYSSGRFPPPLLRPMDPAMSLVAKYERRIAELEQQDRAFKAGLSMGLQALGTRGGPGGRTSGGSGSVGTGSFNTFGTNFDNSIGNNFVGGSFRNQYSSRSDRSVWQRGSNVGGGRNSFGSNSGMDFGGNDGNNFGGFGGFNFNNGGGFGSFGIGGGNNFNSGFGGGGSGGDFRKYQRNKRRR